MEELLEILEDIKFPVTTFWLLFLIYFIVR